VGDCQSTSENRKGTEGGMDTNEALLEAIKFATKGTVPPIREQRQTLLNGRWLQGPAGEAGSANQSQQTGLVGGGICVVVKRRCPDDQVYSAAHVKACSGQT
jgi:hypothetical protein